MKRILGNEAAAEVDGSFAPQLKKQRPMIGAMREVMGVQFVQRHLPKLEPFLRRVVQEEVSKALCRFVHSAPRPNGRIRTGDSRPYRLHFQNSLPQTLFTGSRIEAEGKMPLQIVITDTNLNKIITSGPLSLAKIEILVLDGDFGSDDQSEWTEKEFSDSILREREGKRPLLTGELAITLNNGVGYLGDAVFTDNSSWIRSRKFRLGARLLQSKCNEVSIQEAISRPFWVKDHRGELYKKHHPPSLDDEVWRLEKIGKDGAFHKRLVDNGINTVQDFLKQLVMDPERLRTLLGNGMSNKIWEATIEHAKECVLEDKHYLYCNGEGATLLFNSIYELVGAMLDNSLYPLDDLTASQKILVNKLKQIAYKHPEQIIELNPLTETLPRSLLPSNAVSIPQTSSSQLHASLLSQLHQDDSTAQLSVIREPPTPCGDLLDPLQLKGYYTGLGFHPDQPLGPSQASGFNVRDFIDMQFGDTPSVGLAGPIPGYNSEINMTSSSYPLPVWDHALSCAEPDITGSHISPRKWVKLVAALKLMTDSKRPSSTASSSWFNDEG